MLPACEMKDGMTSPRLITDDAITTKPELTSLEKLRPGSGSQWNLPAFIKDAYITIILAKDTQEPVPVGRVQIQGSIAGMSVLTKETDDVTQEFISVETTDDGKAPKVCSVAW